MRVSAVTKVVTGAPSAGAQPPSEPEATVPTGSGWVKHRGRIVALALLSSTLITLAYLAHRAGIDTAKIRELLARLGIFAAPAFVGLFIAGQLIHIPGAVFIITARVFFGPVVGFCLGYVGALLGVCISFTMARTLLPKHATTGLVTYRPKRKWLARIFAGLEAHPIRTIFVLRLILWVNAPFNYALAASRVSARDFFVGSALGLILPVFVVGFAAHLFN